MKQAIALLILLISIGNGSAQININGDVDKGYRDFVQQTRSVLKSKELSDFASLGGEKRFFSNDWIIGRVTTVNSVTINKNYKFNYDFLDKELYALYNDTVIAIDHNYIASFYLTKNGATHFFVKISSVDNANFVESISYDSTKNNTVQLLKSRTATLVKGDKNSYLANFNGDYADNIKVKSDYYLYFPDGNFTRVKMDKKSLSAALKDYSSKTDAFFSSVKQINEENIHGLLELINSE